MLPIVNPVLWEIGHVGWFHEYWTPPGPRRSAILERGDRLWNSSTVVHATRWDLDLPDRNGVSRARGQRARVPKDGAATEETVH